MGYFEQLAELRLEADRLEGVQEGLRKAVRSLLTKTDFTPEKIAELLDVRVSFVKKTRKKLCAK